MAEISRREFVLMTGVAAALNAGAATGAAAEVFPCSVASGDPSPDGVVLWTRVNPAAWRKNTPLRFEVALDPNFSRVVISGDAPGHASAADRDFTYHVRLAGQLAPGSVYFYRFTCGRVRSRTGRCRTLPVGSPGRLKFAVVTCNDFTNGYYGAFARVAMDAEADFVIHLGDFIYETTGGTLFQNAAFPDRGISLPSGQGVSMGLADYRELYRRYRSDPLLQLAMEFHTWIFIWDDHETADDCYWDYARDTLGAPGHPYQANPRFRNNAALLRKLKLESQRAWSEYVPAAPVFNRAATHPHAALKIWRSFRFGDLLDLFMTDERTYRNEHACGEAEIGGRYATPACPETQSPARTMLGVSQRDWLVNGVTSSPCIWKGWGNEVFLSAFSVGNRRPGEPGRLLVTTDAWDGFDFERRFILNAFRNAGVSNLVVMTGDLHSYLSSYVKLDYSQRDNDDPANIAGVEFMTPAITSSNFAELFTVEPVPRPGLRGLAPEYFLEGTVRTTNPHITFFNSQDWGYSTVEFTRDRCEWTAYSVDKTINSPFVPAKVLRRTRVESGSPVLHEMPV